MECYCMCNGSLGPNQPLANKLGSATFLGFYSKRVLFVCWALLNIHNTDYFLIHNKNICLFTEYY